MRSVELGGGIKGEIEGGERRTGIVKFVGRLLFYCSEGEGGEVHDGGVVVTSGPQWKCWCLVRAWCLRCHLTYLTSHFPHADFFLLFQNEAKIQN